MTDAQFLQDVFEKHAITAVFQLAAYSIVSESMSNPLKYYHNNLISTLNLLNCMVKHNVQYLVFSSTCAVYGNPVPLDNRQDEQDNRQDEQDNRQDEQDNRQDSRQDEQDKEDKQDTQRNIGAVVEDTPFNPISHYGKSKLMIEQIIQSSPVKSVILRYFNAAGFYGVEECHHPETHLIPIAMSRTIDYPLVIMGTDYPTPDGTCIRDYVHVQDIAIAHEKSLEYLETHQTSNTFNLGGKCGGYSVMEIAQAIGCPYVTGERRNGDPACLFNSSSKAQELLGWYPHNSTIGNIIKTIRQKQTF
jgi:UDP-glucose 4-epimerase